MSTMAMPKKDKDKEPAEEVQARAGQRRPTQRRYRLQVDRQTKDSYDSREVAETRARAIKTAFPIVQVAVYDSEESVHIPIEG